MSEINDYPVVIVCECVLSLLVGRLVGWGGSVSGKEGSVVVVKNK
jgi:hypothetical protein